MLPFAPFMFPDSALFQPAIPNPGVHGGVNPSFAGGLTLPCWAEPASENSQRSESPHIPTGNKLWMLFTPSDPGALVDSQVSLTQVGGRVRLMYVKNNSVNDGYGVAWKTECMETT